MTGWIATTNVNNNNKNRNRMFSSFALCLSILPPTDKLDRRKTTRVFGALDEERAREEELSVSVVVVQTNGMEKKETVETNLSWFSFFFSSLLLSKPRWDRPTVDRWILHVRHWVCSFSPYFSVMLGIYFSFKTRMLTKNKKKRNLSLSLSLPTEIPLKKKQKKERHIHTSSSSQASSEITSWLS